MITNCHLREALVSPQMQFYVECKLAPLGESEVLASIEEMRKLLLMACRRNGSIPISTEIIELRHLWFLQTVEYRRLCERLPGASSIEHSPDDYPLFTDPGAKDRKIDRTAGIAILGSCVMNHGAFAADRLCYCPLADRLCRCSAATWTG